MANPLIDTFVFRPGGTDLRFSEGVPVYTDFGELWVDVLASTSPGKRVLVDDTFDTAPTIPAGTYDFTGVTLEGRQSVQLLGAVTLTIPTGVLITNPVALKNLTIDITAGVTTPFRLNVNGTNLALQDCDFITSVGNPAIEVLGGVLVSISLQNSRLGNGFTATVSLSGTSSVLFRLKADSLVNFDAVSGGASETVFINSDMDSTLQNSAGTFTGTWPARFKGDQQQDAANLKYLVGASGNWSQVPENVEAALDRIAITLSILNGGPI